MTRVLSALVMLPVVIGTIWFLPPAATFVLALVAAVLAFSEYRSMAGALGAEVPMITGATLVALLCFAMWRADNDGLAGAFPNVVYLALMAGLIVAGAAAVARGRPAPGSLADAAAMIFGAVYLGLPLGALAWTRGGNGVMATPDFIVDLPDGRLRVLLLMAVIVVSDSAQYYTGRAFGRRPLAPAISPKKTVEGAIGGVVFGTFAMALGGQYVFASPTWILALLGAAISLLGIVGDLFESLLKRSAGIKDSSHLIPGHGGVLDRIDSWLFAAPVYYVFVRFVA
ncbi:MAG TPA: phosphatidate cytidylyltransferase [Vicinamibacterales bacterium]|nr:phosphatidate cytidylyltransferase [Vicinamibacterales bacterium]